MKKFDVCIRGTNFLIKTDNQVKKNGFYAARSVEANDISSAVERAMDSIRAELKNSVVNDKADPPVIKVEDVAEVYYFGDTMELEDKTVPTKGFLWDEKKEEISVPLSAWKGGWSSLLSNIGKKDVHIHTMFIHFTNALYPAAIFFMFLFLLFRNTSFNQTYFYMMVFATFSAPFSYLTGIFEWKRRFEGAMIPIFLTKIRYGLAPFIIGGFCTLWHYLYPGVLVNGGIQSVVFILLNISILPPLIYLGHVGGIIVYEGVD